ncbi:hypothetical protein DSCW_02190 [Desulfosarcina widdelii]|uniref:Ice-binding protein C-terminal domain-containing protein n=1 Tax=Desulfosarcina widdelii TaxID=947919 RepID=A0A5K7YSJ1_9BACT|nr:PEP-CTERM sorting domain-containing protein [Desulfosarcina widdelii]BBO72802.1 hypothetical protein DSCW_02190 [Desulfosarcina widdelii]
MKLFRILPLLSALLLMIASSSFAISIDELNFDQDYWTITDLSTNATGTSLFQIEVEQADYESNFGLYYIDDTSQSVTKFKVFDKSNEPITKVTISFLYDDSDWWITNNYTDDTTIWTSFSNVFGFYYEVYTGGTYDTSIDYTWYTDVALNSDDVEHIGTVYNESDKSAYIYLDDQNGGGDQDFNDMTVFANDVAPAPVPEPATMLLLGTGLIGLAGISRKKMFMK